MSRTYRKHPYRCIDNGWRRTRDKKRWYKAPKQFKKLMRGIQRAKEKEWFVRYLDILPVKRSNDWDWS